MNIVLEGNRIIVDRRVASAANSFFEERGPQFTINWAHSNGKIALVYKSPTKAKKAYDIWKQQVVGIQSR